MHKKCTHIVRYTTHAVRCRVHRSTDELQICLLCVGGINILEHISIACIAPINSLSIVRNISSSIRIFYKCQPQVHWKYFVALYFYGVATFPPSNVSTAYPTRYAPGLFLRCFVMFMMTFLMSFLFTYPCTPGMLHWHRCNRSVSVNQPWTIRIKMDGIKSLHNKRYMVYIQWWFIVNFTRISNTIKYIYICNAFSII